MDVVLFVHIPAQAVHVVFVQFVLPALRYSIPEQQRNDSTDCSFHDRFALVTLDTLSHSPR